MTSSIDPIRRAAQLRRKAQAQRAEQDQGADRAGLPVPVGPARTVLSEAPLPGATSFHAQLLGQGGQRRGLRAGPQLINTATASYSRTEWSGSNDRRTRTGARAKAVI